MLIAEAVVATERSSSYLVKLCQHFEHKAKALPDVNYRGQAHPEVDLDVEWSDDRGVVSFGWGLCSLWADRGTLTLQAEAPDEDNLHRIERLVADHLERFGKRERLLVTWRAPAGGDEQLPQQPRQGRVS